MQFEKSSANFGKNGDVIGGSYGETGRLAAPVSLLGLVSEDDLRRSSRMRCSLFSSASLGPLRS